MRTRAGGAPVRGLASLLLAAMLVTVGCAEVLDAMDVIRVAEMSTPTDGLREALRIGTGRAVERLAGVDGYRGSGDVRIDVPDKLEPVAKALRALGEDRLVDEFVTSMNRAAEAAAPVARDVFVSSIREMTFDDAMTIVKGDAHEATDYFRAKAGPRLAELFRPIVDDKLESVGATREFNGIMDEIRRLPFVERPVLDLGDYVTSRALDGLFLRLEREEERIRKDPAARTTELLKKWFGRSD
jgi:hypothetical protein